MGSVLFKHTQIAAGNELQGCLIPLGLMILIPPVIEFVYKCYLLHKSGNTIMGYSCPAKILHPKLYLYRLVIKYCTVT